MKKLICCLIAVCMLSCQMIQAAPYSYGFAEDLMNFILENYKHDISKEHLQSAAIKAMLDEDSTDLELVLSAIMGSLDEHSTYMTASEASEFMKEIEGSYAGLGVSISEKNGWVYVLDVFPGYPASKVGIMEGDKLYSADGVSLVDTDMDFVLSRLLGEEGSIVNVEVMRNEQILSFPIVREIISISHVSHKMLTDNIALITISAFDMNVAEDCLEIFEQLEKNGVEKVIFDVRNNGGGELSATVRLLQELVSASPIVYVEHKNPSQNVQYESQREQARYECVVLVNDFTASAAEIFAGSIRSSGAGIIIGQQTYGKGTVQSTVSVITGGMIKMTVAEYLTGDRQKVDKVGLTPDKIVKNPRVKVDEQQLLPIDYTVMPEINTNSQAVEALEQRLELLGLLTQADDYFDDETADAIRTVQMSSGLEPTGVVDAYVLTTISTYEYDQFVKTIDNQLQEAIEYLENL